MTMHVGADEQRWCHPRFRGENTSFLARVRPVSSLFGGNDKLSRHLHNQVLSNAIKHHPKTIRLAGEVTAT
jgi:hypothetical protein